MLIAISYSCKPTAVEESTVMKEEADVYAAYINKHYITKTWGVLDFENRIFDTIVVCEMTVALPLNYSKIVTKLPIKDEDIIKDFIKRNAPDMSESERKLSVIGRYPLNPLIKFGLRHILISVKEANQIGSGRVWEEFYHKYPTSRGIVALSKVGFNKKMNQALFYFVKAWTPEAAEAYLVLLEKKDGEWDMVSHVLAWIS